MSLDIFHKVRIIGFSTRIRSVDIDLKTEISQSLFSFFHLSVQLFFIFTYINLVLSHYLCTTQDEWDTPETVGTHVLHTIQCSMETMKTQWFHYVWMTSFNLFFFFVFLLLNFSRHWDSWYLKTRKWKDQKKLSNKTPSKLSNHKNKQINFSIYVCLWRYFVHLT